MAEVRGLCKEVGKYGWKEKKKSIRNVKFKNVISSLHLFIDIISSVNIFPIAQHCMCSAIGGAKGQLFGTLIWTKSEEWQGQHRNCVCLFLVTEFRLQEISPAASEQPCPK